ncbi:MAG: YceI family protein [Arenicellales bacterium]
MKKLMMAVSLPIMLMAAPVFSADYKIDSGHSFVEFRIQHLGYSWLYGRFNNIKGLLSYDAKEPNVASIKVLIDPASVDTNHAERDKHLMGDDFLDVKNFPEASFTSTGFQLDEAGAGMLMGILSLHGVEKEITISVSKIGEGNDPWGGYRAGFEGTLNLVRSDFGLGYNLGPASEEIEFRLGIEAIRQ